MVGRYCNYQRILTDCNSQFRLYIFVPLAAKCKKPVFALKIIIKFTLRVHRFFRRKNCFKIESLHLGQSSRPYFSIELQFFAPYFCWTFFSHFPWAGIAFFNLARWCSKGILGNSVILWAENASYPHFKDFFISVGPPSPTSEIFRVHRFLTWITRGYMGL